MLLPSLRRTAPRRDHAIVMVKFAHDCLINMKSLAKSLELELGMSLSVRLNMVLLTDVTQR